MTLLTMVRSACSRLGLARPSVVATATDATVVKLLDLANEEGDELCRFGPWQRTRKEFTFTTVAAEAQTSSYPTDLAAFVNETAWNRTRTRPLYGPIAPQQWQQMKAQSTQPATDMFTARNNQILILPTPTAGQTVAYEYMSNQWCESSGGTDQSAWAADSDVGLLSERIMGLGLIWRFKKASGMSYDAELAQYEYERDQALAQDSFKPTVWMGGAVARANPPGLTAPETSWDL